MVGLAALADRLAMPAYVRCIAGQSGPVDRATTLLGSGIQSVLLILSVKERPHSALGQFPERSRQS